MIAPRGSCITEARYPHATSTNLWTDPRPVADPPNPSPRPRPFDIMRASLATDWRERFPAHVVATWLEHSPLEVKQPKNKPLRISQDSQGLAPVVIRLDLRKWAILDSNPSGFLRGFGGCERKRRRFRRTFRRFGPPLIPRDAPGCAHRPRLGGGGRGVGRPATSGAGGHRGAGEGRDPQPMTNRVNRAPRLHRPRRMAPSPPAGVS